MGKHGKKYRQHQVQSRWLDEEDDSLPSSAYNSLPQQQQQQQQQQQKEQKDEHGNGESEDLSEEQNHLSPLKDSPSKFLLYQKSVQSPKGDISYMQKFFLMYIGGRFPLHFQEDFCGTALLSTEWIRSDTRRTAIGVDLDLEALTWCLDNNVNKVGPDAYSRISLFHGNVLQSLDETYLLEHKFQDLIKDQTVNDHGGSLEALEQVFGSESAIHDNLRSDTDGQAVRKKHLQPARDIVCAFNYSCCCLHRRSDLVLYFKHAHGALSKRGGIFVMDLYGGTSSERALRLQRRFLDFTYIWEQAEFDIINRMTRISLHFHLRKKQQTLRHAFTYNWRLWSLPEIKDCLEEAGFQSVHFWIREMADTQDNSNSEEFDVDRDVKYEESSCFKQRDAWNAYIVGVAN